MLSADKGKALFGNITDGQFYFRIEGSRNAELDDQAGIVLFPAH